MTKRDFLKAELLKELETKLLKFSFQLKKSQAEFTQKNNIGWFKYQIVFLKIDDGWELKPSLLLRFNAIEDIFHKISEFELKYQKETSTIGTAIEDYEKDRNICRYQLVEEEQIDIIAQQLLDLFQEYGLPFFEKFNTINKLDLALNKDPNDTSLTGDIFKGTKGLIVAKLSRRSNYKELEDYYRKYYQNFADGFYLTNYLNLIKLLEAL